MTISNKLKTAFDNKADINHNHDNKYASINDVADVLGDYATKDELQQAIDEIELMPGPQGEQGPQGEPGEQGENGKDGLTTSIIVNGSTYNHVDGVITLPDYSLADHNHDEFAPVDHDHDEFALIANVYNKTEIDTMLGDIESLLSNI